MASCRLSVFVIVACLLVCWFSVPAFSVTPPPPPKLPLVTLGNPWYLSRTQGTPLEPAGNLGNPLGTLDNLLCR